MTEASGLYATVYSLCLPHTARSTPGLMMEHHALGEVHVNPPLELSLQDDPVLCGIIAGLYNEPIST